MGRHYNSGFVHGTRVDEIRGKITAAGEYPDFVRMHGDRGLLIGYNKSDLLVKVEYPVKTGIEDRLTYFNEKVAAGILSDWGLKEYPELENCLVTVLLQYQRLIGIQKEAPYQGSVPIRPKGLLR
ncbi:MAG: hypothetical protein HY364_05005 [Candidatus Aenigmarchaeota archaeon]|nr:hypothetical protein [Candidatus Aenigmarchaeota archaeon]